MNRDIILTVAKSYIGIKKGSIMHANIIDDFNSVKPDGYTAKMSDPWCAIFVSACTITAYGKNAAKSKFPISASCPRIIDKAKSLGIWVESDKFKPQKGDWILYDWDDSGNGDNTGSPDHVGIVESCKDGVITVIEGNYSNSVKRRAIKINSRYIRGFVTPKYISTNYKAVNESVVKDVLSGKYGKGSERQKKIAEAGYNYPAVQKEVTRISDLTEKTMKGVFGSGAKRKKMLGNDYIIVQWNVNRIIKERNK